jgi:hypothetical protein
VSERARSTATSRVERRVAALLVLAAVAAPAMPSDERFVVRGSCRDGAPNGAYELRTANGQVRVTGAFSRGKPVATFLFFASTGARIAAIPYERGQKAGTLTLWYVPESATAEPRRKLEATHLAGELHGVTRAWHPNGNPRAEYLYQRGSLVAAQAWVAAGAPLPADDAQRLAATDRVNDAALFSTLERTVADNLPACGR